MAAAGDQSKFELPAAEKTTYRKLCKAHEDKEYKKGVTIADSILAKAPYCSDVVALKGLCLYHSDRVDGDEGAIAIIKAGLAQNMRSSALWHALGVIHRGERDEQQALACFKRAHTFDGQRNTHSIGRDLCSLAIQLRDWATYADVRQKALAAKSNVHYHWVTYAVSQHMLGNLKLAAGIMDVLGLVMDWGDNAQEIGQVHLYRAKLALLTKQPKEAITILTKEKVADQVMKLKLLAQAHMAHTAKTSKRDGERALLDLFALGIDQRNVLFDLASVRGIAVDPLPARDDFVKKGPSASADFTALLDEVSAQFPKADAPRRVALDYCPLDQLEKRFSDYCRPLIAKMVPSLTSVFKSLYLNPERVAVIEKVVHSWDAMLTEGGEAQKSEFAAAAPSSAMPDPSKPNPLWQVFVWDLLSSHYLRKGDFAKAHEYISKAIDHTPTIEMLHVHRAKIYSREGNVTEAAFHADIGRKLDLQDRYLNTKSGKYYLRAGDVEAAESVLRLFLKASPVNDTFWSLMDLQNSWYEIELGDAFMKRGDVMSALRAYKLVEKHFQDNHDDLLEYHGYCLRRCNILTWFEVIENDEASTQRHYLRVAPKIIKAYLHIQENGANDALEKYVPRPDPTEEDEASTMDQEDLKRLQKLVKDADIKISLDDVLASCRPYLTALNAHRAQDPQTHLLTFEVNLRDCRPVLAAAAIRKLSKLPHAAEAEVATCKKRLAQWVQVNSGAVPSAVAAALKPVLA